MRVCLIGSSMAPSKAFSMLKPVLEGRGDIVTLLVANGKPAGFTREDVQNAVPNSDIVVIGMSAPAKNAELEIFAAQVAREYGILYGFYGDVAKCWGRASFDNYFGSVAEDAEFYLGVHLKDADDAEEVFPDAQLFGTGNPAREEEAFAKMSRKEVRKILEIGEDEKLILVPGSKFAGANFAILAILMEALREDEDFVNTQIIFCPHPGDKTPFAVDPREKDEKKSKLGLYEEFLSQAPVPMRLIQKDIISSTDAVSGADLIVEFGSSIGFTATYQRIPVITVPVISAVNRWYQINGSRTTELMDDEASYALLDGDPYFLTEAINNLLNHESEEYKDLVKTQEEKYPLPKNRGEALQKMADAIHSVAPQEATFASYE